MEWWQGLVVAVTTYAVTKLVDHFIAISQYRHEFKKKKTENAFAEIEDLKDEVGRLYERSANWKSYEMKADDYEKALANDDYLIGKYNKYPEISRAARETVHYCKIVAYDEREHKDDVVKSKKELSAKYKEFIVVCNNYIEQML
jgi:hypothetical protein